MKTPQIKKILSINNPYFIYIIIIFTIFSICFMLCQLYNFQLHNNHTFLSQLNQANVKIQQLKRQTYPKISEIDTLESLKAALEKGKADGIDFQKAFNKKQYEEVLKSAEQVIKEKYQKSYSKGKEIGLIQGASQYFKQQTAQMTLQQSLSLLPLIIKDNPYKSKLVFPTLSQLYKSLNLTNVTIVNAPWTYQAYSQHLLQQKNIKCTISKTIKLQNKFAAIQYFIKNQNIEELKQLLGNGSPTIVTILWQNMKQFKKASKNLIIKILQQKQYKYYQSLSLKMRRMQGKILMVFFLKKAAYVHNVIGLPGNPEPSVYAIFSKINIHTDIYNLREWLIHHKQLGINKFFLYQINQKNQIEGCLNLELSISQQLLKILQEFSMQVTYIPWNLSIKNRQNSNTELDYLRYFSDISQLTIFTSLSEFIISANQTSLGEFSLKKRKIVSVNSSIFMNRFCDNQQYHSINMKIKNTDSTGITKTIIVYNQLISLDQIPYISKRYLKNSQIINQISAHKFIADKIDSNEYIFHQKSPFEEVIANKVKDKCKQNCILKYQFKCNNKKQDTFCPKKLIV